MGSGFELHVCEDEIIKNYGISKLIFYYQCVYCNAANCMVILGVTTKLSLYFNKSILSDEVVSLSPSMSGRFLQTPSFGCYSLK